MDSRGKLMFDLNEYPTEVEEESTLQLKELQHGEIADPRSSPDPVELKKVLKDMGEDRESKHVTLPDMDHNLREAECNEREEGEWSDAEGSFQPHTENSILQQAKKISEKYERPPHDECGESFSNSGNFSDGCKVDSRRVTGSNSCPPLGFVRNINNKNTVCINSADSNVDGPITTLAEEEFNMPAKQRDAKSVEVMNLRSANNQAKRKIDHQREAMLGKKRSRQIVLINIDEAKQAVPNKSSTPRKPPIGIRSVKEVRVPPSASTEKISSPYLSNRERDQKQAEAVNGEVNTSIELLTAKVECNGDRDICRQRRTNGESDSSAEQLSLSRQGSYKQVSELRQSKKFPSRKVIINGQSSTDTKLGSKKLISKKPSINGSSYQDTSVERLIREVTNDKFWHRPEDSELQCVPGRFESDEEYVRVFEPLLFEECRAQLYSTWEELAELAETNIHVMVRIKSVQGRERGWYDAVVLPSSECKWTFKEGDVAVLSTPKPGTVKYRRSSTEDEEPEIGERVAGTVRRHIPLDIRDPPGAILHFFVGDCKVDDDHIMKKLQPGSTWYLTVLGSLATTQREYVALHAFSRLNPQMQNAILKPSANFFPDYEQQTPAMPECFTPNFVDHLHKTFNGPQLAAIKWAAMHTAAGTNSAMTKRQDPWPFTLVQGPPGTGKTHTVWGMLNVIHLVQYQHYYTSLLKKLAPQSYKQANEISSESIPTGSIDEVLYNMDQNLFRTLSKLCPKPRMLVCAPSNAATDELLTRVLDRGFIDGEMKLYRPDVARVGVDSQTRAAQAVSVERRTEQLLQKSREDVSRWMQDLRAQETYHTAHIADLQNKLHAVAADGRLQGSVGVDPDVLLARDQSRDALLQSLAAAVESRDKVLIEISRLLILESRFRGGSNFNLEEARANLEASFANEAEIVFTTVSSSGRKLFARLTHGFDMVVIDEAAQASEVAVLPPLALGAPRCVLVGDPQQLPATVISKAAGTLLYSRSLFKRFQQAGCPTMLLSVQYRMHPQIRDFPSRYFYQGRLTDSESVVNSPDEVYYKDSLLRPYLFFDITHGRESHRGGSVSYQNVHEAQFCFQLYDHLQKTIRSLGIGRITVGIITPYKLQLKCLQHEFSAVLKSEEGKDIYINTVDAFQGQERDVIIMSCVRASNHGVGFVADIRRMNVALTRARRALWVMGNANSLMQSDDWAALIADARARNCLLGMDSLPKEFLAARGIQGKGSSNLRSTRSGWPRIRSLDTFVEPRSGLQEDEEYSNSSTSSRNGSYRPLKQSSDGYLEDYDQTGNKSRESWQQAVQRRQNSYGVGGKRDI